MTPILAVALALAALAVPRLAGARPSLQVVGSSRFDARATRAGRARAGARARGSVAVSGALLDDVDTPVGDAPVLVRFVSAAGATLQAFPCDGDGAAPLAAQPDGAATVVTGADGAFCARAAPAASVADAGAAAAQGDTRVLLSWPGTRLLKGAHAELTIDPSRAGVTLAFDPEPRVIPLGAGTLAWQALAGVDGEGEDEPTDSGAGLALRLVDERGVTLGEATTDARGAARFIVPEAKLAPPGPGELRLLFDGDARHAKATKTLACERRVEVTLGPRSRVEGAGGGPLVAKAEEIDDETTVDLDVTSAAGPVPGGSVEGRAGGAVLGAAPVVAGHARLTVRWPAGRTGRDHIEARYVPDAPWYVAGPPTPLALVVHRAVAWRRIAVVAAGVVILAWFVLSRSRLLAPRERPAGGGGGGDRVRAEPARIERVAEHAPGRAQKAWEGRVVDAHDGEPVRGAVVMLERGSFDGLRDVARATTDDAGRFTLDGSDARPGDQIAAHGALHGRVARAAPPPGVLEIALVSRRRALVRRLVDWARHRGSPYDATPEPTPAHVVRVAADDARTVRWARAVEEAAFGRLPVDAARETEIDALGHEGEKP